MACLPSSRIQQLSILLPQILLHILAEKLKNKISLEARLLHPAHVGNYQRKEQAIDGRKKEYKTTSYTHNSLLSSFRQFAEYQGMDDNRNHSGGCKSCRRKRTSTISPFLFRIQLINWTINTVTIVGVLSCIFIKITFSSTARTLESNS